MGSRTVLGVTLSLTVVLALFPARVSSFARPSSAPSALAHPANVTGQAGVATDSPTATASFTALASPSATGVVSPTAAASESATASPTPSPSESATESATASPTATPSLPVTGSLTVSPTASDTMVATDSPTPIPPGSPVLSADYARLPLQFEPNRGQADPQVLFQTHGPGYTVYLTANQAVLGLFPSATPTTLTPLANGRLAPPPLATLTPAAILHLSLVGANPQAAPAGQDQLPGTVNYFHGSDPSGWLTNLPTYGAVAYPNVYPGIDLVYHGRQTQLEYDFRVQPGADPSLVRLHISGADTMSLDQKGNLVLSLGRTALIEGQPTVYQEINGQRVPVGVRYTLLGGDQVGFALGSYSSLHPLVIDPVLSYSSYLGGSGWDAAQAVTIDSTGAAYLTGYTASTNFPLAGGTVYQNANAGGYDVFVSKLNPAGTALVYSTYLGGSGNDYGEGIAVDSGGNAYVTGYSSSTNYPTLSAYQATNWGNPNIILTKLNPSGSSLVYSTYLGGSGADYGTGVTVDSSGYAFITGYSGIGMGGHWFPITAGAYQTINPDGTSPVVVKVGTAGNSLVYSTYINGNNPSYGNAIAVDSADEAYITGNTTTSFFYPTPFPTTPGAYQSANAGGNDVFVSRLNSYGSSLVSSTLLGGSGDDYGQGIKLDSNGNPYVTGYTTSSGSAPSGFPTTSGAYQTSNGGYDTGFVSKFNPTLTTLLASTYLGGSGGDYGMGIALDGSNNPYITGYTASANFPLAAPVQASFTKFTSGWDSAFVSELNPSLTTLPFSTYLGGANIDYGLAIATDSSGNSYLAGQTDSPNFPTKGGVQGSFAGGNYDAFVTKLGAGAGSTASSGTIPWHPHFTVNFVSGLEAGVDLADGHVDVSADDLHIAGRGVNLDLTHTWDSTQAAVGGATWAGQGWNTDLTQSMSGAPGGTIRYTDPTGAVWVFTYSGGAYVTPAGLPWRLTTAGGAFTLTNVLTGDTRSFNAQGNLTAMSDSYGNNNTLTGTVPSSETNSGGRAIALAYTSGGLLGDVQSPLWVSSGGTQTVAGTAGQHVTYAYQGQQLTGLTRAALTGDAVTDHFAYTGNQLTSVTTPITMEGTLAVTHTWTLAYDGAGRVTGITSPISGTVGQAGYTPAYTTTFTYNVGNTVVTQGSGTPSALTTTYTLDSQGEPTQITDGLSHSDSYTYDADHDVLTYTDGNLNLTTNTYTYVGAAGSGGIASTGLISRTVLPAIHPNYPTSTLTAPTTNYVYDPTSHDLTEQYDNYGAATFYTYNGSHDISSTAVLTGTTVVGPTTYYHWRAQTESYDSQGEPLTTVDGRGLTVPDTTSLTAPTITPNAQAANFTHSWTYTSQGDLQTSTTPPITTTLNGNTTTGQRITQYTYDGDGDLRFVQSPNNYNAGNPTANATEYGYDRLGRQNSVKLPSLTLVNPPSGGPTTGQPLSTVEFDGEGNLNMRVDTGGSDYYYSYDPLGRLVSTQEPLTLRTEPDPRIAAQTALTIQTFTATNLASLEDPQGNITSYSYDAAGRPTSAINAAGQQTSYGYDNADNLTSIKVGNPASPSSTIAYTYDALNEPTTQTVTGSGLGGGLVTTSSYDLHGHLVRQQDPNNDTTFAGYDLTGLLLSQELDPGAPNTPTGAHHESFAYDAAGNRIGSIDFRGGSTQMTVDGDNRQTAQLDSYTGTTPISSTAGFDPDGNLVSQLQTIGGQSHAFSASLNPADWPQQATNDGLTSSTTGAGGGDVLAQTIQNQAGTLTYNIDQAGRDNQIGVLSMGASTPLTTTYAFNDNEQMTGVALPNNVEQDAGYDGANRLTSLSAQNTANHTLLNNLYQYGYDPLGLTTAITTTVQGSPSAQTLNHDAAGRLTAVTGGASPGSWSYDGRGNLSSATISGVTKSYSYNPSNPEEVASTSISGQPTTYYGYDGAGDTTSITTTSSLNRQLTYDAQTRLTQITFGSPITQTVALTYTAFGQRANYAVTPSGAGQPSLSEHFQYQGDQLSQVAYTGTSITTPYTDTYVYSQDGTPLELLRQQGASVTPYWYVLDGQSNVVALTNQSGTVVDSYTYDQWGKPLTVSETVPQQLRYAGSWYDNELGWYWLSVRPYDPTLERFMQPDPSEIQGLFSYVYAGDNPSDLGDPSGLSVAIPLKSGTLVTPDPGSFFENNVAVNSPQWIGELNNGTKSAGGGVGALLAALVPGMCGMAAVCMASFKGYSAAFNWPFDKSVFLCLGAGPGYVACLIAAHFHTQIVEGLGSLAYGVYNLVAGNDIATLTNAHASGTDKFLAVVDLASNALVFVPIVGEGTEAAKLAEATSKAAAELHGATDVAVHELGYADAFELDVVSGGCACFPGATGVLTPHGLVAIASLHVGDRVLAEDPATGKVEPEKVKAVIDDGIQPLMQVRLSDSSSLSVTTNHPFYVDSGPDITAPRWVPAGSLRVGDRIRTANGQDISVVALRYHMGQAHVYTLTVAADHDFFVGSAAVLVHNAGVCRINAGELPAPEQQAISDVMNNIATNTRPPGKLGDNWGAVYKNLGGDLPAEARGYYHEYTALPPGATQRGVLRVVTGGRGEIYFTWTHYGKSGAPAFVQVR